MSKHIATFHDLLAAGYSVVEATRLVRYKASYGLGATANLDHHQACRYVFARWLIHTGRLTDWPDPWRAAHG